MNQRVWTKGEILTLITSNDVMVEKSILVLYARQTEDERRVESTNHNNGMGFNGVDAKFMSSLAKQIKENKYDHPEGRRLTPRQRQSARKGLKKYAQQLTDFANNRERVKFEVALGMGNAIDADTQRKGCVFDERNSLR